MFSIRKKSCICLVSISEQTEINFFLKKLQGYIKLIKNVIVYYNKCILLIHDVHLNLSKEEKAHLKNISTWKDQQIILLK